MENHATFFIFVEVSVNTSTESCVSHVTYRLTLLRAVGSGDVHGVEPGAGVFICEALNGVTQFPLKVLHHRLARVQYRHALKETHFCLLYTHIHTETHTRTCISVSLNIVAFGVC